MAVAWWRLPTSLLLSKGLLSSPLVPAGWWLGSDRKYLAPPVATRSTSPAPLEQNPSITAELYLLFPPAQPSATSRSHIRTLSSEPGLFAAAQQHKVASSEALSTPTPAFTSTAASVLLETNKSRRFTFFRSYLRAVFQGARLNSPKYLLLLEAPRPHSHHSSST